MPEHTNLTIASHGILRSLDGFVHGEVLMVARQYLIVLALVLAVANEVLDDVDESFLPEHTFEEHVVIHHLGALIHAVLRLPLHESVLARSNRASLRLRHVAHHAEHVVGEHRRNLLHVVLQLAICSAGVCLLPRWRLQLHQHHRQTIQEQNQVGTFLRLLHVGPLVHQQEVVSAHVLVIHQIHDVVLQFLAVVETHLDAMLQIVHEQLVVLHHVPSLYVEQLPFCLVERRLRQSLVQLSQHRHQALTIHRAVIILIGKAALYVVAALILIAQLL